MKESKGKAKKAKPKTNVAQPSLKIPAGLTPKTKGG